MGLERNLSAVAPVLLTANGGTEGQVQVTSTLGFFVKQTAILQAPLIAPLNVEIKRVLSDTQLLVGPISPNINHRVDVSLYTVAAGSFIFAVEQPKATLAMESRIYASYIQEPSNSWRVTPVDSFGNSFDSTNPLPVAFDGTVTIGEVEIIGPSGHLLDPNIDGSVKTIQLFTLPFDAITATYPTSIQEVYQSRVGGITGTVQQTLTVNYVDSTKNLILNVSRS